MDLSNLKPAKGSVKQNKRLGRGQGSGRGRTATRGHKGQKSRSGYSRKFGFEGGQQPLQTRVPKFGFKNINRKEYKGINLDTLQSIAENKKINKMEVKMFASFGLASKNDMIKILGRGELKTKLEVNAHAFSKSAKAAIEKHGGKAIQLSAIGEPILEQPDTKPKKKKPAENKKQEAKADSKEKDKKIDPKEKDNKVASKKEEKKVASKKDDEKVASKKDENKEKTEAKDKIKASATNDKDQKENAAKKKDNDKEKIEAKTEQTTSA